ncbi:MAG: hypothetical protein US25_C0026G0005 [Candidatus Moranbacteria bacterium GW2011_GWE1_36_7]|nr:MAG: hypothetical protein UR99_C0040G0005 [Candidatus Moranbacteria bacterium GW2011_GWD2_36_12]KKQ05217.1 MAG: hypothetical protein US16_C0036G0005 [Candidatus Moranbacteria bacterium GW2011_GWE2_36_40]KKQ14355.1 MAG: hypothetical protein US25_C0026G0005 [Candidatus Moranbacteria bacterium GW2011_GWE1_36_7]
MKSVRINLYRHSKREGAYFIKNNKILIHTLPCRLIERQAWFKVMQSKQKKSIEVSFVALVFFIAPIVVLAATSMGTPTVEDCVSRAGMTKEKCTEMISNFKSGNMGAPPAGGQPPSSASRPSSVTPPVEEKLMNSESKNASSSKPINVSGSTDAIENITKISTEKEKQFAEIETRISKIIEFLQKNNVDVVALENNLATLKSKHAEISNLFSTYIKALNGNGVTTTTTTVNSDDIKTQIKTALANLATFYSGTLKISLNSALSNVNQ